MTDPMREVTSVEVEWRTSGRRGSQDCHGVVRRRSHGRACLHVRLDCGHAVQRFVALDRAGVFVAPTRARCDTCVSATDRRSRFDV